MTKGWDKTKSMTPGVERTRAGMGSLIRGTMSHAGLSGEVVGGELRAGWRGGTKGKELQLDSLAAPWGCGCMERPEQ